MAAINRFGMNSMSTPLLFRVDTVFSSLSSPSPPHLERRRELTQLDFTRNKARLEIVIF